jgi:predicted NBD/HSP70 family sugar kinase
VSRVALAIDLGGTKASFAVVDATGAVLSRIKRSSHEGGAAVPFESLAATAGETVAAAGLGWDDVRAAGLVVLQFLTVAARPGAIGARSARVSADREA